MFTQKLVFRNGAQAENSIALAPLTNIQSHSDGRLSPEEFSWLLRRAKGNFGVISTCAAYVSEEGKAWDGQLGIANDTHDAGLRKLATAIKNEGACGIVQLHHGGSEASLAPNFRLSTVDDEKKGIRGATFEDIARVQNDFVEAAQRALKAGFAGVEIHGANGYLFTQFLAPQLNTRSDEYGGDLVGRVRFLREVVQAVRASVPDDFIVGVRISPVDAWAQRGLILRDGLQVGQWMCEDGVDYVHLSLSKVAGVPRYEPDEEIVLKAFRAALPKEVPIFGVGGIWTKEDAEEAKQAGADVIVIGRAAIGNPDWPKQFLQENFEPIRTPWTREHLKSVDVSEKFINYISNFPAFVVGGRSAR